ncbi:MAG: hypothetical protein ACRDLB_01650 [Actinomycetota bacterium]
MMETQRPMKMRARATLVALLLIGSVAVVLGGTGTSSAQIYNEPSSPPTGTQTSAPPTSPATSPPTSPDPSCPAARAGAEQGEPCSTPTGPPNSRGDGPNVEENELVPNFNEGPNVLDQDPLTPDERGATTPGEGLPFTGADLTLMILVGGAAIAVGVILVRSRRRTRTAA